MHTAIMDLRMRLYMAWNMVVTECPYTDTASSGGLRYHVPENLRAVVQQIAFERLHINTLPLSGSQHFYSIKWIESAQDDLIKELRLQYQLPEDSIIEFHGDWVFTVTTLETLRQEYEIAQEEKRKREAEQSAAEDKKVTGLCFAYKNQPPEVFHLQHMLGHEFSGRPTNV